MTASHFTPPPPPVRPPGPTPGGPPLPGSPPSPPGPSHRVDPDGARQTGYPLSLSLSLWVFSRCWRPSYLAPPAPRHELCITHTSAPSRGGSPVVRKQPCRLGQVSLLFVLRRLLFSPTPVTLNSRGAVVSRARIATRRFLLWIELLGRTPFYYAAVAHNCWG